MYVIIAIKSKPAVSHPKKKAIKLSLPKKNQPQIIFPQLATLVDTPPAGYDWLHEIKLDGYRLIANKLDGKTKLFTRHNNDWSKKFKSIVDVINHLPIKNAIFDGEVVVLDHDQHANFQMLQNSIKENKGKPFIYYVFDLLYYDQYDLTKLPLLERKNILQQIIPDKTENILRYSDHIIGSGKEVFEKSCELGLEGIVSKEINSSYIQKRSKAWLKTKCLKRQEFIIGGFTQPKGNRKYFGSLLLGTYNKQGKLNYNGNVGTGFTEVSLKTLHTELKKNMTTEMPFDKRPPGSTNVTWVKPILIAEVEFTEWTQEDILRHPSFKGLRSDKPAKQIIKEKPVKMVKTLKTRKSKISRPKDGVQNQTFYRLTNPTKILYPEGKITKADVALYYDSVQEWILPYIVNRPLTIVRCPEGYHNCFYQKHINDTTPPQLYGIRIKEKENIKNCIYIKDVNGLMALPQMGTLEIHPWGSKIETVEKPDIVIFDLDPAPDVKWSRVVDAAFAVKHQLEKFKLHSFVKTTGGKGLHIVIPIKPQYNWDEVKNFAHAFVDFMVMQNPKEYIGKMSKLARKGKIYIDYMRNQRGATAIAPYSTRARKGAPIATPLAWDELTTNIKDTHFTIKTILARLDNLKQDPWRDFYKIKQSLRLEKLKF